MLILLVDLGVGASVSEGVVVHLVAVVIDTCIAADFVAGGVGAGFGVVADVAVVVSLLSLLLYCA